MSTSQEVRSILRDSGVPLTSKQIIEMLPAHCSPQSAYVFLSDAKKRGELETILEDGKAAYRFVVGKTPTAMRKSKPVDKGQEGWSSAGFPHNGNANHVASVEGPPTIDSQPASSNRNVTHLADAVGYANAALTAYIESCVDKTLYGFLLNARDAAVRALEKAHA